MAFSASESAFEGFRIIRREPATVAIWAVVLLVLGAIVSATMLPVLGQFAAGITPGATATSPAQLAAFGHLMQLYLVVFPLYLVLLSVFTAAIYRVVLRPQDRGFARLKLGADELRLVGLCLLMGLLSIGFSLVVLLVAGALVAGLALAFRTSAPAVGVIGAILIYLLMIAAYIWVGVRLSFAAPMTFTQKRIRLFSSWRLTKGRFWPLLGCYLLAWVFMVLVLLVDLVVSGVLMLGAAGGSFSRVATTMFRPDVTSAMNLLSPIFIVRLVVGAVFGVVMWTVALAAPAAAYRAIAAPRPEDQAETFS